MNPTHSESRGLLLFADDDTAVREGLAELLRRVGFEVVGAASAVEALDHLREKEFDALISDIHMPGNSGLEMIANLPQIAAGLPVVLLTGRPTVETAARSVRLAVTAYLTKPPDMVEITAILDQAIASYRGFRAMQVGRVRLQAWEKELDGIETLLRQSPPAQAGGPMGSYLRLTLRQVMLMLADLEQATKMLDRPGPASEATLTQIDHAAALKHTVDVLGRTKQNFKSKDLADLRRQLEGLLSRSDS